MTIYSLYIFDRHCACVYYQDWNRTKGPKSPTPGGLLPNVSRSFSSATGGGTGTMSESSSVGSTFSSPRNTLASSSGIVVAINEELQRGHTPLPQQRGARFDGNAAAALPPTSGSLANVLPFDEEAKLVYGVILSLRNMVKTLSKRDEQFSNYSTSTYKLHLFETASGYKFVLLTDPRAESARFTLRQLYCGPFLEYVVRNPLIKMDSRERGIDNDYFRAATDRMIKGLAIYQ